MYLKSESFTTAVYKNLNPLKLNGELNAVFEFDLIRVGKKTRPPFELQSLEQVS